MKKIQPYQVNKFIGNKEALKRGKNDFSKWHWQR